MLVVEAPKQVLANYGLDEVIALIRFFRNGEFNASEGKESDI